MRCILVAQADHSQKHFVKVTFKDSAVRCNHIKLSHTDLLRVIFFFTQQERVFCFS